MSVGPIAPPLGGIGAATASASTAGQAALSTPTTQTPTLATTATPAQTAVDAAVIDALSNQDSLGALLADLSAALDSPALPPAAQATAKQILTLQAPLDSAVTGPDLRAAVAGSGLFLETLLATAVQQPGGAPPDLSSDLKALLTQLTDQLSPQAEIAAQESAPHPEPVRRQTTRGPASRPSPPARGAPTAAQPPARPSVGPQTDRAALARTLRQDAQSALARLQLSQIASLPKPGAANRWTVELPVASPDGHAMAQFEISRDDRGPGAAADAEPIWRARFSLDVEPGGPIHAEVALSGGRTRVTLWGEREATRQNLASHQADLVAELAGPEGADAAVRVLAGTPAPPAAQAGQLVNRTS